jgi:hypothetical protein
VSPRPWYAGLGPGDEQAPCELEGPACAECGGSGEDEQRRLRVLCHGGSYSPGDYACDACEGTGYATPAGHTVTW